MDRCVGEVRWNENVLCCDVAWCGVEYSVVWSWAWCSEVVMLIHTSPYTYALRGSACRQVINTPVYM